MERKSGKRVYQKPKVVSDKVFEQAALACQQLAWPHTRTNLKNNNNTCGWNAS